MKKITLVIYLFIAMFGIASVFSQPVVADPVIATCKNKPGTVLLYPAWYSGINTCRYDPKLPDLEPQIAITKTADIWIIALNLVQWLIITAGYVALYFVIWGGIKYITSRGDPARITSAKGAITNAVIGLVIALVSVIIVRAVQGAINGNMV